MKAYNISIHQTPDAVTNQLVNEYWEINNGKFVNKPTFLASKYGINMRSLIDTIKVYSECIVLEYTCVDCNSPQYKTLYSQSNFTSSQSKRRNCSCDPCLERKRIVARNLILEQEREKQEIRSQKFQIAIAEKKWRQLPIELLEILKQIVSINNKTKIYKEVFNGDYRDKQIWGKVRQLEKLGLIDVPRDKFQGVEGLLFHDELEYWLYNDTHHKNDTHRKELQTLNLHLKNNLNKTSVRQPNYAGVFDLKEKIVFEPGVKYVFGGWKYPDGSINLSIMLLSSLTQNVKQYDINDPIIIQELINKFFDQINPYNLEEDGDDIVL